MLTLCETRQFGIFIKNADLSLVWRTLQQLWSYHYLCTPAASLPTQSNGEREHLTLQESEMVHFQLACKDDFIFNLIFFFKFEYDVLGEEE